MQPSNIAIPFTALKTHLNTAYPPHTTHLTWANRHVAPLSALGTSLAVGYGALITTSIAASSALVLMAASALAVSSGISLLQRHITPITPDRQLDQILDTLEEAIQHQQQFVAQAQQLTEQVAHLEQDLQRHQQRYNHSCQEQQNRFNAQISHLTNQAQQRAQDDANTIQALQYQLAQQAPSTS